MAIAMPIFGAAVGALLAGLLPKLYEEIRNLEDTNRVHELDQEIRHIDHRMEEIIKKGKDMNRLERDLVETKRLLVYDIEDLIDSKDMIGRLQLSAKIKDIVRRVAGLQDKLKSLKVEETTSSKPTIPTLGKVSPDALKEQEEFRPQQLQGMKERADDVLDLVHVGTTSEKKLKVISIAGFGGIGKTLLAREVFNSVQKEYPVFSFVHVGKRDKKKVLEEIEMECLKAKEELLKQQDKKVFGISQSDDGESKGKGKAVVASDDSDVASTSSPLPRPANENEPRYFIVIDDVMDKQLGKRIISDLEYAFAVEGGPMTVAVTVVLTTPVLSVAQGCRSDHVYQMRPLNSTESKDLFMNVACIQQPITANEELMEEIGMKCDGLPLALVCLAKFCGKNINDKWKEAWRVLGSPTDRDVDLERIQQVLEDSYASLCSYPLQASLLYFCLFPHGHPVRKGSILRRWLAEGPEVDCGTSAGGQHKDQMSNAERCFETLVGHNVIWPHQEDVKTWKPPGFLLEYIRELSGTLNFILLSSPDNVEADKIRRLSLHHTGVCDDVQVLGKKLFRLRTLAVFRKAGDETNLCFDNCKMLRLLDLEECNGLKDRHVDEICQQLRLLKYLSLGASITEIPRNIVHLQRLETLDLGKQTVVKVPAEVIMLPELKYLLGKVELLTNYTLIRSDTKSSKVKKCLEESKLETLAGFVIARSKGFPQLMHGLKNVKKVKIWCDPVVSRRNVKDVAAFIRNFLARGLSMADVPSSLSIDFQENTIHILDELVAGGDPPIRGRCCWSGRRKSHHGPSPSQHGNPTDGAPSQQNSPIGCLASLKLKGFSQLTRVPAFLSKLGFIYKLCLSSRVVTWKDILEGVSNLGTLKYLKVVEEIDGKYRKDNSATDQVVMQKDKLDRLEQMCLVSNAKLPGFAIENGALKSLISLHLICRDLVGSFEINYLERLQQVGLHYGVEANTRSAWKEEAKKHPNTPQVLLIHIKAPQ